MVCAHLSSPLVGFSRGASAVLHKTESGRNATLNDLMSNRKFPNQVHVHVYIQLYVQPCEQHTLYIVLARHTCRQNNSHILSYVSSAALVRRHVIRHFNTHVHVCFIHICIRTEFHALSTMYNMVPHIALQSNDVLPDPGVSLRRAGRFRSRTRILFRNPGKAWAV